VSHEYHDLHNCREGIYQFNLKFFTHLWILWFRR